MRTLCALLTITILSLSSVGGQNLVGALDDGIDKAELKEDTVPSLLYQFYFGNLEELNKDPYRYLDIQPDPYYYRLFVPMTFYHSPMNRLSESLWKPEPIATLPSLTDELLPLDDSKFAKSERVGKQVDRVLMDLYLTHPELVRQNEDQIMSRKVYQAEVLKEAPKTSILSLFKPDAPTTEFNGADIVIQKPNFWTIGGNGSLQFTQNYISTNWYKGGESAHSLLGNVLLFGNYNDQNKIQFENSLEVKLGFNTVSSDTIRKYRINTDLLRLYSKLGVQAAKNWYYTVSMEVNSQLFNNYKKNTDVKVSSFLAPANLIASIGMDYKLKKKKIDLSVFISPIAYNLRYVGDKDVDETKFGLEKGDKTMYDFGSKLQSNMTWKIIPSVTLTSRLYYFTSYEKVEAEWENTFDFILNRYLSTKLFVHTRFDDGAKRVEDKSYFQLKELLSFGINYKW
ncbi:DUF3078 domain-containing protein [Bacteroides sp. 224]|uniref:DUF3078 domain-containing protein n=1 Tax=Bacteroides sp. 224 TaxID=2302936 RepID=UPI0013D57F5D|nr:DUF3078 domain-containing protein [Bacteroides sp. 224]NDV65111.1 DUF3078 domain-containing protein [Bacteroides sp. 224]